jgi:hypothetical protein
LPYSTGYGTINMSRSNNELKDYYILLKSSENCQVLVENGVAGGGGGNGGGGGSVDNTNQSSNIGSLIVFSIIFIGIIGVGYAVYEYYKKNLYTTPVYLRHHLYL